MRTRIFTLALLALTMASCHRRIFARAGDSLRATPDGSFDKTFESVLRDSNGYEAGVHYLVERSGEVTVSVKAARPGMHLVMKALGENDAPLATNAAAPGEPLTFAVEPNNLLIVVSVAPSEELPTKFKVFASFVPAPNVKDR